jgi:hypothetical protein
MDSDPEENQIFGDPEIPFSIKMMVKSVFAVNFPVEEKIKIEMEESLVEMGLTRNKYNALFVEDIHKWFLAKIKHGL